MDDSDNAFTGLKTDARGGGFDGDASKGVYFNPAAAEEMANQCGNMLQVIDMALQSVSNARNLQSLNQRDSGAQLAAKLNAAANNLVDNVLKDHKTILTDMGQTFVAAGALFKVQDQAAADAIRNNTPSDQQLSSAFQNYCSGSGQPGLTKPGSSIHVDAVKMTGWGQSNWDPNWDDVDDGYSWSGTAKIDYTNKLSDTDQVKKLLTDLTKGLDLDPVHIEPEYGSQYEWDDFHNHWQYIKDSKVIGDLESYAQSWHAAQTYVKVQSATFKSAANKYLSDYQGKTSAVDTIWASPAAKKAKDAVQNYLTNLEKLSSSMELMSANLVIVQGWVKKLQNFLPYESISKTYPYSNSYTQKKVDDGMRDMRQAWDAWYAEGVKDSSGAIPIIPPAKAAVTVQAPTITVPPVNQGNGNPSPSGVPTTQTPKLDTTTPTNPNPTTTDPANPNPTTTNPSNPTTTTDQTQQTLQTLITQGSTALQAGITAAESAVEKVASAIQTGLQSITKTTTDTTTDKVQSLLNQELQQLGLIPNGDNPSGQPTGGSPTGGSPTGGSPGSPGSPQTPKSQLFPRAATPASTTEEETTTSRAGLATTSTAGTTGGSSSPMGGSPMSAASQGQGKEYKRAQYLNAGEHLEEALGEVPAAVKPVAEK
ncbi:hypothetical protein GFY24_14505 [Nocardia sp. SYP-A9097]|uniref:hypothetical protein n=1 Tax=Nocardia sp. SYP-A9097 TaxID=2663237 RepID=UPI00129BFA4C|nr:hypothetical protein [Nocardia sp. SYP-A9097]MRH88640.1 hypothetical protein [Nocardia sp. SYP-A9097]